MKQDIKKIQCALQQEGYNPGPIDGIMGRRTKAAVLRFQSENGLVPTGELNQDTMDVLLGNQSSKPIIPFSMPWLIEAYHLLGVKEIPGQESNQEIIGWSYDLGLDIYTNDDIPWCGLFVAHCIGSQLPDEPMPSNVLGARNWKSFGIDSIPQLGAIMVFWRGSPTGWSGHVGFYWAEDDTAYHILGGNQSNQVSITRISKTRLIAARWPKTVDRGSEIIRKASVDGMILSNNEA